MGAMNTKFHFWLLNTEKWRNQVDCSIGSKLQKNHLNFVQFFSGKLRFNLILFEMLKRGT